MQDSYDTCFLCGRSGSGDPLEVHHLFGGPNRKLSEQYGLKVKLCGNRCHRNGKEAVHRCAATAQTLHEYGQRKWIAENNGTVEGFIRVFGKSYL